MIAAMNRVEPQPCDDVGLAAFIVGCLCHEGYVPLNLGSSESRQDYMNAIRLTASILTETKPDDGGATQLPFPW
jgi:hypothetical protein